MFGALRQSVIRRAVMPAIAIVVIINACGNTYFSIVFFCASAPGIIALLRWRHSDITQSNRSSYLATHLSIALSPLLTFLLALVPLKLSQIRCCEVLDFASLLEYYVNIWSRGYDCSVDPFITSVFSEEVKQYRWQQRCEQHVGATIWP